MINLETAYPGYRVFMSEDHESGQHRDPWNFELRNVGGRGKVWPYGGERAVFPLLRPARKSPGRSPEALASIRPLDRSHSTILEPIGAENPGDTASEAPDAAMGCSRRWRRWRDSM